jgi:bacterioferritin
MPSPACRHKAKTEARQRTALASARREAPHTLWRALNDLLWLKQFKEKNMTENKLRPGTREKLLGKLMDCLNKDLSRTYQNITIYGIYSQVTNRAAYRNMAGEIEKQAQEELHHALLIAEQIHSLGGIPVIQTTQVKAGENMEDMFHFQLEQHTETIGNYRERIRQCEALGEYAMAEQIGDILLNRQQHRIDMANALGNDLPSIRMFLGNQL